VEGDGLREGNWGTTSVHCLLGLHGMTKHITGLSGLTGAIVDIIGW